MRALYFLLALAGCSPQLGRMQRAVEISSTSDGTADMVMPVAVCATPELDDVDPAAVRLTPSSYATWNAMFRAKPDAIDYLLAPGNYMSWGRLTIQSRDGTPTRRRTIRFDGTGHPVDRPASEALVDSINIYGSSHWTISGLTQRVPTNTNDISQSSTDVVFDRMLVEQFRVYGVRVRASNVCIQRSVIREAELIPGGDSVGVQIKPLTTGVAVTGARVLSNEIYDVGDAVQVTADGTDAMTPVDFVIASNDFYTSAAYAGCTENGIDVKAGSSTVSWIRNNRIWGYVGADTACSGTGGQGDALDFHIAARNVIVEGNVIGEGRFGLNEKYWPSGQGYDVQAPRNLLVAANYFYEIEEGVFRFTQNGLAFDNVIVRSGAVCDDGGDSGYRAGGPRFFDTIRVGDVPATRPSDLHPCPYVEDDNLTRVPFEAIQWPRRLITTGDLKVVEDGI